MSSEGDGLWVRGRSIGTEHGSVPLVVGLAESSWGGKELGPTWTSSSGEGGHVFL